jgi:hypothetical protein
MNLHYAHPIWPPLILEGLDTYQLSPDFLRLPWASACKATVVGSTTAAGKGGMAAIMGSSERGSGGAALGVKGRRSKV